MPVDCVFHRMKSDDDFTPTAYDGILDLARKFGGVLQYRVFGEAVRRLLVTF